MRPLDRLVATSLMVAQGAAVSSFVWLILAPAVAAGALAAFLVATVNELPRAALSSIYSKTIRGASASRSASTFSHFSHTRRAIAR